MKPKNLKLLIALAASIAAIALGQRSQSDQKQRDVRTQRAHIEGFEADTEAWFV